MSIGISGAAGHLGRTTVDRLLERIEPSELVLVTRDVSKLDEYAARGAVVRHGDFDEPASLPGAFAGVDRLLIISTDVVGRRIPQHLAAVEAAKAAGVRHLAYTSITNPTDSNAAAVVPEHRATEEAIIATGVDWTMLRNAIYAEYQIAGLQAAIQTGQLVHNGGDGVCTYVSRDDCAAVAAAVLAGDGYEGQALDVTGSELLSGADRAAIAAEVGGVPVEVVAVDDETYVAGLVEHAGLERPVAEFLATFGRAVREGAASQRSTVVEDLTGSAPRSLRDLLAASSVPAA